MDSRVAGKFKKCELDFHHLENYVSISKEHIYQVLEFLLLFWPIAATFNFVENVENTKFSKCQ